MSASSGNQVIIKIIGGLGNQLFQYVAGRSLAERTGGELVLDTSGFVSYDLHSYSLDHFQVAGRIATEKEIAEFAGYKPRLGRRWAVHNFFFADSSKYALERHYHFDPSVLSRTPPVYLDGYWQSEKYFSAHEQLIRRDLHSATPLPARDLALIEAMSKEHSVSLHVRRGDFVSHTTISAFHGTCSPQYYKDAVALLAEKVGAPLSLYIFSDDPAWVRENLQFPHQTVYVDHNDASKNYIDMLLMSSCKYHIIANSSFSWWGAWLDARPDKLVIAPRTWVRDAHIDTKDLLPPSWIRI